MENFIFCAVLIIMMIKYPFQDTIFCVDHPSNTKRGICIYYKNHLPIIK